MSKPVVRPARPADVAGVVTLAHELADYERAPQECTLTAETLAVALFGGPPAAFCHVAEVDGTLAGMALWFPSFFTWTGVPGLYLEDLFVRPEHRGAGVGRALLRELAGICVDRGYGRFEWAVLDWNTPAQGFYSTLGARPNSEWTVWRCSGDALKDLGHRA